MKLGASRRNSAWDVDDTLGFELLRRNRGRVTATRNILHVLSARRVAVTMMTFPSRTTGRFGFGVRVLGKGGGGKRAAGHQAASKSCKSCVSC